MRFQLYQSHSLTAIVLKNGKYFINWGSVNFRDLQVTLKSKLKTLNFCTNKKMNIEDISNTV